MMKFSKIAALAFALTLAGIATSASAGESARRTARIANFGWLNSGPTGAEEMKLGAFCTIPADYVPELVLVSENDVLLKVDRAESGVEGACPAETELYLPKRTYNKLVAQDDKVKGDVAALGLRSEKDKAKKTAAEQIAKAIAKAKENFDNVKKDKGKRLVK